MSKESTVALLLKKAWESLGAAEELLESGYPGFSAARSYYAMFYAAEAALLVKDLRFSTHSGVIGAFAAHFVKSGVLPPEMSRELQRAADLRQEGDYSVTDVPEADARNIRAQAETFVAAVVDYLRSHGYSFDEAHDPTREGDD
ncbi:MAG: HEPN domain-containing protein [Planctomycetota bacterium]